MEEGWAKLEIGGCVSTYVYIVRVPRAFLHICDLRKPNGFFIDTHPEPNTRVAACACVSDSLSLLISMVENDQAPPDQEGQRADPGYSYSKSRVARNRTYTSSVA